MSFFENDELCYHYELVSLLALACHGDNFMAEGMVRQKVNLNDLVHLIRFEGSSLESGMLAKLTSGFKENHGSAALPYQYRAALLSLLTESYLQTSRGQLKEVGASEDLMALMTEHIEEINHFAKTVAPMMRFEDQEYDWALSNPFPCRSRNQFCCRSGCRSHCRSRCRS